MQTELRHTLVQYHGGGYSGCFWEWNYFYIDADGQFHNIEATGSAGCKTVEQAEVLLAENSNHTYTYNMTDDKAIEEFCRECNVVHVTGVLQWFEDNPQPGIEFFVLCSECEQRQTDLSELSLEEWHSCGGIATTADKLVCVKCCSLGTCQLCNEYTGTDDMFWLGGEYNFDDEFKKQAVKILLDDGYTDVCDWCLIHRAGEIEQEVHNDMLSIDE